MTSTKDILIAARDLENCVDDPVPHAGHCSSTSVHTPGPWEIVKAEYLSHNAPGFEQMLSPGGIMGGTPDEPSWVIEGEIEWEPDARLIAAAPAMLMALLDLKVIAELHITDLAADVQEGRTPDAIWNMEMARWSNVVAAIARATQP